MKIRRPKILLKDLKLQGERINLRPPILNDAEKIYRIIKKDKEILKNTLIPYPITIRQEKRFVEDNRKRFRKMTDLVWLIEDSKTKNILASLVKSGRSGIRQKFHFCLSPRLPIILASLV